VPIKRKIRAPRQGKRRLTRKRRTSIATERRSLLREKRSTSMEGAPTRVEWCQGNLQKELSSMDEYEEKNEKTE